MTRWHYSRRMPVGKLVRYGVWEQDQFVGAVVFARGASPHLGDRYRLDATEVAELVRVALSDHQAPVSQIVAAGLRLLRAANSRLRLVVSFADPGRGHHGGIYQAGNWIYSGQTPAKFDYLDQHGRRWVDRLVVPDGRVRQFGRITYGPRRADCTPIPVPGKYRYLYPLDRAMRRKITPLAQPYPRGGSVDGDTSGLRPEGAGSTPAHRSS